MDADFDNFLLLFQMVVQWIAIILSASSGVYDARRYKMDYFGALVIAVIVAVGGGTLRDLLLGRYPLFWLSDPIYLTSILIVGIVGILLIPVGPDGSIIRKPQKSSFYQGIIETIFGVSELFVIIDAIALGLWAYLGTIYAMGSNISPFIAPVMGVITASFGGVMRDVFFAKIPELFKPGQFYALASFGGAVAYVICWYLSTLYPDTIFAAEYPVGFIACITVTFIIRMLSIKYNITSY